MLLDEYHCLGGHEGPVVRWPPEYGVLMGRIEDILNENGEFGNAVKSFIDAQSKHHVQKENQSASAQVVWRMLWSSTSAAKALKGVDVHEIGFRMMAPDCEDSSCIQWLHGSLSAFQRTLQDWTFGSSIADLRAVRVEKDPNQDHYQDPFFDRVVKESKVRLAAGLHQFCWTPSHDAESSLTTLFRQQPALLKYAKERCHEGERFLGQEALPLYQDMLSTQSFIEWGPIDADLKDTAQKALHELRSASIVQIRAEIGDGGEFLRVILEEEAELEGKNVLFVSKLTKKNCPEDWTEKKYVLVFEGIRNETDMRKLAKDLSLPDEQTVPRILIPYVIFSDKYPKVDLPLLAASDVVDTIEHRLGRTALEIDDALVHFADGRRHFLMKVLNNLQQDDWYDWTRILDVAPRGYIEEHFPGLEKHLTACKEAYPGIEPFLWDFVVFDVPQIPKEILEQIWTARLDLWEDKMGPKPGNSFKEVLGIVERWRLVHYGKSIFRSRLYCYTITPMLAWMLKSLSPKEFPEDYARGVLQLLRGVYGTRSPDDPQFALETPFCWWNCFKEESEVSLPECWLADNLAALYLKAKDHQGLTQLLLDFQWIQWRIKVDDDYYFWLKNKQHAEFARARNDKLWEICRPLKEQHESGDAVTQKTALKALLPEYVRRKRIYDARESTPYPVGILWDYVLLVGPSMLYWSPGRMRVRDFLRWTKPTEEGPCTIHERNLVYLMFRVLRLVLPTIAGNVSELGWQLLYHLISFCSREEIRTVIDSYPLFFQKHDADGYARRHYLLNLVPEKPQTLPTPPGAAHIKEDTSQTLRPLHVDGHEHVELLFNLSNINPKASEICAAVVEELKLKREETDAKLMFLDSTLPTEESCEVLPQKRLPIYAPYWKDLTVVLSKKEIGQSTSEFGVQNEQQETSLPTPHSFAVPRLCVVAWIDWVTQKDDSRWYPFHVPLPGNIDKYARMTHWAHDGVISALCPLRRKGGSIFLLSAAHERVPKLKLWSLDDPDSELQEESRSWFYNPIISIAADPTGDVVVAADDTGLAYVHLLHLEEPQAKLQLVGKRKVQILKHGRKPAYALATSALDGLIFTGSADTFVKMWRIPASVFDEPDEVGSPYHPGFEVIDLIYVPKSESSAGLLVVVGQNTWKNIEVVDHVASVGPEVVAEMKWWDNEQTPPTHIDSKTHLTMTMTAATLTPDWRNLVFWNRSNVWVSTFDGIPVHDVDLSDSRLNTDIERVQDVRTVCVAEKYYLIASGTNSVLIFDLETDPINTSFFHSLFTPPDFDITCLAVFNPTVDEKKMKIQSNSKLETALHKHVILLATGSVGSVRTWELKLDTKYEDEEPNQWEQYSWVTTSMALHPNNWAGLIATCQRQGWSEEQDEPKYPVQLAQLALDKGRFSVDLPGPHKDHGGIPRPDLLSKNLKSPVMAFGVLVQSGKKARKAPAPPSTLFGTAAARKKMKEWSERWGDGKHTPVWVVTGDQVGDISIHWYEEIQRPGETPGWEWKSSSKVRDPSSKEIVEPSQMHVVGHIDEISAILDLKMGDCFVSTSYDTRVMIWEIKNEKIADTGEWVVYMELLAQSQWASCLPDTPYAETQAHQFTIVDSDICPYYLGRQRLFVTCDTTAKLWLFNYPEGGEPTLHVVAQMGAGMDPTTLLTATQRLMWDEKHRDPNCDEQASQDEYVAFLQRRARWAHYRSVCVVKSSQDFEDALPPRMEEDASSSVDTIPVQSGPLDSDVAPIRDTSVDNTVRQRKTGPVYHKVVMHIAAGNERGEIHRWSFQIDVRRVLEWKERKGSDNKVKGEWVKIDSEIDSIWTQGLDKDKVKMTYKAIRSVVAFTKDPNREVPILAPINVVPLGGPPYSWVRRLIGLPTHPGHVLAGSHHGNISLVNVEDHYVRLSFSYAGSIRHLLLSDHDVVAFIGVHGERGDVLALVPPVEKKVGTRDANLLLGEPSEHVGGLSREERKWFELPQYTKPVPAKKEQIGGHEIYRNWFNKAVEDITPAQTTSEVHHETVKQMLTSFVEGVQNHTGCGCIGIVLVPNKEDTNQVAGYLRDVLKDVKVVECYGTSPFMWKERVDLSLNSSQVVVGVPQRILGPQKWDRLHVKNVAHVAILHMDIMMYRSWDKMIRAICKEIPLDACYTFTLCTGIERAHFKRLAWWLLGDSWPKWIVGRVLDCPEPDQSTESKRLADHDLSQLVSVVAEIAKVPRESSDYNYCHRVVEYMVNHSYDQSEPLVMPNENTDDQSKGRKESKLRVIHLSSLRIAESPSQKNELLPRINSALSQISLSAKYKKYPWKFDVWDTPDFGGRYTEIMVKELRKRWEDCDKADRPVVLVSGDIVENGTKAQYDIAKKLIRNLSDTFHVMLCPGNRDLGSGGSIAWSTRRLGNHAEFKEEKGRFCELLRATGSKEASFEWPQQRSFERDDVVFIGMNSFQAAVEDDDQSSQHNAPTTASPLGRNQLQKLREKLAELDPTPAETPKNASTPIFPTTTPLSSHASGTPTSTAAPEIVTPSPNATTPAPFESGTPIPSAEQCPEKKIVLFTHRDPAMGPNELERYAVASPGEKWHRKKSQIQLSPTPNHLQGETKAEMGARVMQSLSRDGLYELCQKQPRLLMLFGPGEKHKSYDQVQRQWDIGRIHALKIKSHLPFKNKLWYTEYWWEDDGGWKMTDDSVDATLDDKGVTWASNLPETPDFVEGNLDVGRGAKRTSDPLASQGRLNRNPSLASTISVPPSEPDLSPSPSSSSQWEVSKSLSLDDLRQVAAHHVDPRNSDELPAGSIPQVLDEKLDEKVGEKVEKAVAEHMYELQREAAKVANESFLDPKKGTFDDTAAKLKLQVKPGSVTKGALVIGNDTYPKLIGPLKYARNGATAVANQLDKAGYTVFLHTDLYAKPFREALREFHKTLKPGAETQAVFYYAGHGGALGSTHLLLPIDPDFVGATDVAFRAIPVSLVQENMSVGDDSTNVIILDCCRTSHNIGKEEWAELWHVKPPALPSGPLSALFYACGQYDEALDHNPEDIPSKTTKKIALKKRRAEKIHSVVTKHLLTNLLKPNWEVQLLFAQVMKDVEYELGGYDLKKKPRPRIEHNIPAGPRGVSIW